MKDHYCKARSEKIPNLVVKIKKKNGIIQVIIVDCWSTIKENIYGNICKNKQARYDRPHSK